MIVDVTEDHSLFNDEQQKIKPSRIKNDTKLEYYKGNIKGGSEPISSEVIEEITLDIILGVRDRFPIEFMNTTPECYSEIIERWESMYTYDKKYNKTIISQLLYFKNQI